MIHDTARRRNGTDVPILSVHSDSAQPLYDAHPRADAAKDGVFIVEEGRRSEADKELGPLVSRASGIRGVLEPIRRIVTYRWCLDPNWPSRGCLRR